VSAARGPVSVAEGPTSAAEAPASGAPSGAMTRASNVLRTVRRVSPEAAGGPTTAGDASPGEEHAPAPWEGAAAAVGGVSEAGHSTPVTGSPAGSGVTLRARRQGIAAPELVDAPATVDEVGRRLRPPKAPGRGLDRSGETEPGQPQVVNVNIGRVEVRNPLPPMAVPQPVVAADPGPRPLSLDEYLDRRNRS
jgi:hypothetical protein